MLNKLRYAMYRFMQGRYGNDALGLALLALSFIISILGSLFTTQRNLVLLVSYLPLLFAFYRILSRKISARRKENKIFLNLVKPFKKESKRLYLNLSQKQHRHYSCPKCGQLVRVPSKRGRIEISCPHCKTTFIKKT